MGLIAPNERLAAAGFLAWFLVVLGALALLATSVDVAGRGVIPWNALLVPAAILCWLLLARRLRTVRPHAWPDALLSAAIPFAPLLLLWPLQAAYYWIDDRELRLFVVSLALSASCGLLVFQASAAPGRLSGRTSAWLMAAAALFYVVVFGLKSRLLYESFSTGGSTPAGFDQALWNGAHWLGSGQPLSHFMASSLCCDSILSDHAFLIFLPLLPFYALGLGGPVFLMALQAAATAAAAIAIYLLARPQLGAGAALAFGIAYLAFFANQRTGAGDFRVDAFVAPLLLFALVALSRGRLRWYLVLVSLALACKEEVAFVVIALGVYVFLFKRARRLGAITMGLALAWFAVDALIVMPYFGGTIGRFLPYYRALGNTPAEIATTLVQQPDQVAAYLFDPARLKYLLYLFVPLGFMPWLGLPVLIVALPRLALNTLSGFAAHYSLSFWYEFSITPFLFVAAIDGCHWLGRRAGDLQPRVVQAGAAYVLAGCLLSALFWGPNPLAELADLEVTPHDRLAQAAFSLIPPDASVAAQSSLAAHLAHRRQLSVLPDVNDADYLLFDVFNPNRGPQPEAYLKTLQGALDNPDYGLIFYQEGYFLFQRGADPHRNVPIHALAPEPQIQHPRRVEMDGSVAFLGYDLAPESAAPGQPVLLTTYWQSLAPVDRPYLLFLAAPGVQMASDPVFGLYPVVDWQPGQVIRDERSFVLPALADGSDYEVAVGLLASQADLHLISPDQFLGQNVVRIVRVDVKAGQATFSTFAPQGAFAE